MKEHGVPADPSAREAGRLHGVDGLRAVAALSVLAHHVWLVSRAPGASTTDLPGAGEDVFQSFRYGLVLFFALSGFLLFRPFAAAILRGQTLPNAREYLRNRALRILPAYWVILLVTALVLAAAATDAVHIGTLTDPAKLAANLALVQNYHPDTVITGIGPAWSLGVEVIFYLALPLLAGGAALLAARSRDPRGRVIAVVAAPAALLVLGLASKGLLAGGVDDTSRWAGVARLAFPVHGDLFAFGMFAAIAHVLASDGRLTLPRAWRPAALAAGVVALFAASLLASRTGGQLQGTFTDTIVGAGFMLILAAVCLPGTRTVPGPARVLSIRPLAYLGLISYSIYLWHMPVILVLRRWGVHADDAASLVVALAAVVPATVALSALTYHFVEAPAMARKHRWAPSWEPRPDVPGAPPVNAPSPPGAPEPAPVPT